MPFTFSHPAIVLPATLLPKRTYSLTGLVIGSVTPDFEYFIRMKNYGEYSHTWLGLLWFDLPLGFLLAFVYHGIVRDALLANLPRSVQTRLSQYSKFNWTEYVKNNWILVIISLLMGTLSHFFWDSFTHSNGYFVQIFPMLKHSVSFFEKKIHVYDLCQHLSTIVGGLAIIYYIFHLPKNGYVNQYPNISYWIYIVMISLVILGLKVITGFDYKSFYLTIVTVISSGLIAIIVTSFLFRAKFIPTN